LTSNRNQVAVAASITVLNIAVAVAVNLLTSSWSWLVFVILALLSGAWIGLEGWRVAPKRRGRQHREHTMAPEVEGSFVPRPELTTPLVRALLGGRSRKVGITTLLTGAGGFGKTTLALAVCALDEVRGAFPWIYWVPVGQEMTGAALAAAINDISERADGQRPGLTSPEQAGLRLGGILKDKGRCLLVVDDVWTPEQLRPFLAAGRGCTLLVTTRFSELLPAETDSVEVDQMSSPQARDLVAGGISLPTELSERLLELTGRWPLALGLTNGVLRRTDRDGADVAEAARRLAERLSRLGPVALDVTDAARRTRTVAATLESSFGLLGLQRERVVELGIFPEDTEIPLDLLELYWQATAKMEPDESAELCRELADLSLVSRRPGSSALRLHDVIRSYLRHECGAERMAGLNTALLDAVATTLPDPGVGLIPWWQLPDSSEYLWHHLSYHLAGAGRQDEVTTLVTEPHWVIGKLRKLGPVAVAEDLALVGTAEATELSRFLDQLGHLLTPTTPMSAVVNALAHRLPVEPVFAGLQEAAAAEAERFPRLVSCHPLPDLPDPALNRVLVGHEDGVSGCAYSPAGDWLVSGAGDGLRVWDADRGLLLRLIADTNHGIDSGLTLSASGRFLAVDGSDDKSLQVFETTGWHPVKTLTGHRSWLTSCCFSADERTVISGSEDKTLRFWDVESGRPVRTFKTEDSVDACVALPNGQILGVEGGRSKIWDPDSGEVTTLSLTRSFDANGIAVSPGNRWVAISGDQGVAILDLQKLDRPPRVLHHHTELTCVVFSPDGGTFATGSGSGLIVLWSTASWRPIGKILAASEINKLAFSPNGSALASAGDDATVRLWNPALAQLDRSATSVNTRVQACRADQAGTWFAVATDSAIAIYDPESTRVQEELEFDESVYLLKSVGTGYLAAELAAQVLICEAGNLQASRSLELQSERVISNLSTGGDLVAATDGAQVIVWNIETWEPPVFLRIDRAGVYKSARSSRGSWRIRILRRVYSLSRRWRNHRVRFWLVRRMRTAGQRSGVSLAQLAPDGKWIAIAAHDSVHIRSTSTWEQIAKLQTTGTVDGIVFLGTSRLVAQTDENVYCWNTTTWQVERTCIDDSVLITANDADSSLDGRFLATVSDRHTVRVHDWNTGDRLTEFRLDDDLTGVDWLPGHRLAAGGTRGVYWFDFFSGIEDSPAS
jgi:WD40 repeat protein